MLGQDLAHVADARGEAEGELEIVAAWYGDGDNVWAAGEGEGGGTFTSEVTVAASRGEAPAQRSQAA